MMNNSDAVLSSLREDRRMRRQEQAIYGSYADDYDYGVYDDHAARRECVVAADEPRRRLAMPPPPRRDESASTTRVKNGGGGYYGDGSSGGGVGGGDAELGMDVVGCTNDDNNDLLPLRNMPILVDDPTERGVEVVDDAVLHRSMPRLLVEIDDPLRTMPRLVDVPSSYDDEIRHFPPEEEVDVSIHHENRTGNAYGWMNIDGDGDVSRKRNYWTCGGNRRRKVVALFAIIGLVVLISIMSVTVNKRRNTSSPDASENAAIDEYSVDWNLPSTSTTTTYSPTYSPSSSTPVPQASEEGSIPGGDGPSIAWDSEYDSTTTITKTMAPSFAVTDYYNIDAQDSSSSPTSGGGMDDMATTPSPTSYPPTSAEPTSYSPTSAGPTSYPPTSAEPTYAPPISSGSTSSPTSPYATCGNGDRGNGMCPNNGECCGGSGYCIVAPQPCKTRKPTTRPTTGVDDDGIPLEESSFGAGGGKVDAAPAKSRINIELRTDEHGEETSWTLYSVDATNDRSMKLIASVGTDTYGPYEEDNIELDVDAGKYRFTLKDSFGDGFGTDGMFAVYIDGRELVRANKYWFELSYDILAGYDPESSMTDRDREWLVAHNVRRETWHQRHGETYVPLTWSTGLAEDALSWATDLLNDCDIEGIKHESGVEEGENLAKNRGTGDWDQLYPADNILTRWVENEETWPYPDNAHLTQALWRASRYLGCGEAVKTYSDGIVCRIQVCRYVRAGNCDMARHDATEGENWLTPMLMDTSNCGPECPPEGCF